MLTDRDNPSQNASGQAHNFTKDKTNGTCALCRNLWSSKDMVTSKFQICTLCGVSVHTNCRPIAQVCIKCDVDAQKIFELNTNNVTGWFHVKVIHAYDINVVAGTALYAQVRLKHGAQALRSLTADAGQGDCLWEANNEVASQLTALKFHIQQGPHKSSDILKELKVEVEIWSTFLGFFDTCLATGEIDVTPVFLFPGNNVERWFTLTNKVSAEGELAEGKLLLNMLFESLSPVPGPTTRAAPLDCYTSASAPASASIVTPFSKASTLATKVDPVTREAVLHRIAEITAVAVASPEKNMVSPAKVIDSSEPLSAVAPPVVGRARGGSAEARSRSSTSASVESIASAAAVVAVTSPSTPERAAKSSQVVASSSPATDVDVSSAAISHKSDAAIPSTTSVDFYQSIADFTERTTNSIGNFFYEIEALNLSSATRDAIDGDWNDNHKILQPLLKPGEVLSSTKQIVDTAPAQGVGYMHIHVVSAFKTKVKDVSDGDHYVLACVEDTKREFKSKSVFGSATPIFNVRWTIKMEHFRSAVNLYLVDAYTHRRIATARLSCYSLMQRDVDKHIKSWKEAPTENIVLRGVSDGEEMGHLTAEASFEEDVDGLFLTEPLHDAPLSPPEVLSVQRLSAHIARFTALIELINLWYAEFLYITEWQDPMTTFVVFLLFLYCTLKVQAEYALSGVMFAVVVLMTRSWMRRRSGLYVKHYVEVGVKAVPKLDYKPIAHLRVSVLGFRNTGIREHRGIGDAAQGHVNFNRPSMKVTYLSMPEVDAKDTDGGSEHTIGYFGDSLGGVGFAMPEASQGVSQLVSNMVNAEVVQRDAILHNVYDPWPLDSSPQPAEHGGLVIKSETPDLSLVYPILQPISAKVVPVSKHQKRIDARAKSPSTVSDAKGAAAAAAAGTDPADAAVSASMMFLPWERNESAVKVSFIDEQHTSFGGPNEEYITVPLRDVVMTPKPIHRKGKTIYEMTKWYRITKPQKVLTKTASNNDLDLFAYDSASSIYLSATDRDTGIAADDVGIRRQTPIVPIGAEVCVRLQLETPPLAATVAPTLEEKESSLVLQTLLKGNEKSSSTISVLWNMTDNVKYVQNLMNGLLDQIESIKNILNWTSPNKTFPLYVAVVAIWLVTVLVPGRLIILAIGVYEFFFVFLPIPEGRSTMIRFGNLIQSIPNDDDIAQIYAAEKKAFATSKHAEWRQTEKSRKLELVLASRWQGRVSIKGSSSSSLTAGAGGLGDDWVEVYLLLQGRRLVWWASEEALEIGKMAAGQLLLCGHSGLAQVSPMDVRKFGGDTRLIAVFGQDYVGRPQKLTIMLNDSESKAALYRLLDSLS